MILHGNDRIQVIITAQLCRRRHCVLQGYAAVAVGCLQSRVCAVLFCQPGTERGNAALGKISHIIIDPGGRPPVPFQGIAAGDLKAYDLIGIALRHHIVDGLQHNPAGFLFPFFRGKAGICPLRRAVCQGCQLAGILLAPPLGGVKIQCHDELGIGIA